MSLWIHFSSPACAVGPGKIMHAVEPWKNRAPGQKRKRRTHDAACGRQRVRLFAFQVAGKPDDHMTIAWPPYVADAREWGFERCSDCMKARPGRPTRPLLVKP